MDKNTIIGFILIFAIVIGFAKLNQPSEQELTVKHRNDSIALAEQKMAKNAIVSKQVQAQAVSDTATNDTAKIADAFGGFSPAAVGTEKFFTLENELIKLTISNKGGRIYSAQLKNYRTHDSLPLVLFDGKESSMDFTLATVNNRVINSSDLYLEPVSGITTDSQGNKNLILRLKTSGQGYMDFAYTLPANSYMVSFGIKANAMTSVIPSSINSLDMHWKSKIRQQEKGRKFEDRYSAVHYKYVADDPENLSESRDDQKELPNKVKWVAFKDQFFSSILIANDAITSAKLNSKIEPENSGHLKSYSADMVVGFDPTGKEPTTFRMFFGPNQFKVLHAYDKGIESENKLKLNKLIPLGWGIFGWINQYAIIPMFNLFSKFIANFGIIILLMTIVIKLVLFPLTYKSYLSTAKMKVLKPEIDEINARIPAEKAMERQKATMDLYSKVGVSPMSGCIPSLLSMPILFAMFSFFPAAIELRQQSFLWATDLSAYDSIMTLPFSIPFGFGNHVSLFCLLMTVTNIIFTKVNMANTATNDQPGAGMMKWMMYLMPVMFLFMFNSYASGLSYYYFISTLLSISQTYIFRLTIDEKKLLAQLHAKRASNAKKPAKKGSFMERLEKMQHEQEKQMRMRNRK